MILKVKKKIPINGITILLNCRSSNMDGYYEIPIGRKSSSRHKTDVNPIVLLSNNL